MTDPVEQNAQAFLALGNPVRLSILRLLVQGHEGGTAAGAIQERIGIPASTLSHHLSCLASTDLVRVERDGTTLRYRPNFTALRGLTDYLWQDCCQGGRGEPLQASTCCPRRKR